MARWRPRRVPRRAPERRGTDCERRPWSLVDRCESINGPAARTIATATAMPADRRTVARREEIASIRTIRSVDSVLADVWWSDKSDSGGVGILVNASRTHRVTASLMPGSLGGLVPPASVQCDHELRGQGV